MITSLLLADLSKLSKFCHLVEAATFITLGELEVLQQ